MDANNPHYCSANMIAIKAGGTKEYVLLAQTSSQRTAERENICRTQTRRGFLCLNDGVIAIFKGVQVSEQIPGREIEIQTTSTSFKFRILAP